MPISLTQSALCPILIGRGTQTDTLSDLLAQAATGQGHVALIAGEAGIGKSRLVVETESLATQQGFSILQGHCFEQDRSFPYAPLLDLLRAFMAACSAEQLARYFGDAAELIKLLPELAKRMDGIAPSPPLEPEQEKRRLFRALTDVFTQLSSVRPLLVSVEDLHWSDETSLELLLYLSHRLASQPILLLLTYRTHEPHPSLTHFLVELDRQRVVTELKLTRLARPDVEAMVHAIFELPNDAAEFLNSLYDLTEGNPFFVEELLKALVTSGEIYRENGEWTRKPMNELHVPRSVQDAVVRRTAQLSDDARRTMALAAVAGRRFDFGLLQTLTGHHEHELLQLMKELIAAQLVVELSDEQFAFRHALTRQAIYAELLARERKALHRRIGETVERIYAGALDAYLGDLSYHFYAAGAWETALVYSLRAAEQAERLYAHEEALRHYEHARSCAKQLNQPGQLAAIDEAMGNVFAARGQHPSAAESYRRALELAPSFAERARLKAKIGASYTRDADERGLEFLQAALVELNPETQVDELARTLVWLGRIHWHRMRLTESIEYCERARQLAEPADDALTLSSIYYQLSSTYSLLLRFDDCKAWAHRVIALGERKGYPASATMGYAMLAQSSAFSGKWQDALDFAARTQQLAEKIDRVGTVAWSHYWRYLALYGQGELKSAAVTARITLSLAQEIGANPLTTQALASLTLIESDLGNAETASAYADNALRHADLLRDVQLQSECRRHQAHLYVRREEWEQALALFDECAALLSGADSAFEIMRMGADRAETHLALGQLDKAANIAAETLAIARAAQARHFEAVARRVQGRILTAQRSWDEAALAFGEAIAGLDETGTRLELAHTLYQRGFLRQVRDEVESARADWMQARTLFEHAGARPMLWRTHVALGQLAQAQNQVEQADYEFAAARTVVEELAAGMKDDLLRTQLFQRAAKVIPPARPSTRRRVLQRSFNGLTTREREVAALIARGKTNRDIADALVLSERTVEGHVGNILGKLGFTARTQIAAWAVEKELVHS